MKRRMAMLFFVIVSIVAVNAYPAIVIDHNAVEMIDQIPDYWINEVRKMLLNVPGESHSSAYQDGLVLLSSIPDYEKLTVNVSTIPEMPTDAYLRISSMHRNQENTGWMAWSGEHLAKNVEKGASGSAELGATQSTNNSVKADAVKTFSAAGRAGNIR